MNMTKFFISTIAYAVLLTALATVYHDSIFGNYYYGFNIYSAGKDFSIPIALTGTFIEGAVLSYLIQRFKPAIGVVRFGIMMGILVCLFASSYDVFQTAALEKVQGAGRTIFMFLEFIAMMLYGVVGGTLVGWIHRK